MQRLQNYQNGKWKTPDTQRYLPVENPSTREILAELPCSTSADVDGIVAGADAAFRTWSDTPVGRRCDYLFQLCDRLRKNHDELARIIVREMGKSLPDAHAELKRTLENCEVACGAPTLLQGQKLIGAAADVDGEVLPLPVGVFAAICPFNFPAMVPFWFLPYALASGNTYIVKASEQVPLTMTRIFELIDDVGFPPGVVNLVHGDREAGQALVQHARVQGISSVGCTGTASQIAAVCTDQQKRCQAFGGAKNYLVVMPDAPLEHVVRNMITSCFGCAGQRCMAASAIGCVGRDTYDEVVSRFLVAAREIPMGDPLQPRWSEEAMVLGPVISDAARQRILGLIDTGIQEGAHLAMDGRSQSPSDGARGYFIGPTVFTDVRPGMAIERTEIFGPVVVILHFETLTDAIDAINAHPYGNGASIYTQNGHHAREFKLRAQAGMIGVNVGIPAPVACLPFGGMKQSRFADIKAQGPDVFQFFTERKIITERYWPD